jgi:hypothetical protein
MNFALITGASKGIGKALAQELASRKVNLLLVARSQDLLKELAIELTSKNNITVHYLAVDLTHKKATGDIYSWCLQNNFSVDTLVNNAGYGLSGIFDKYSLAEYEAMMQVNMNTAVALIHLFLPMLKKQNQAYILNVGSTAAYQAVPGLNVYAATKAFMESFSRSLNYELRNTSVSVTCVNPGATESDFAKVANVTGEKAVKMAKKVNMQPTAVAKYALNAMYAKKVDAIPGLLNKITTFFVWLLPKRISEKMAADIYDL